MSILPVYLCSFSSVSPLQRGMGERAGLDKVDRSSQIDSQDVVRKSVRDKDDENKRYSHALVVRSGDVVSNDGDVFSLSAANRSEKSTQELKSKEDVAKELTEAEIQQVSKLKQRDAEVKAHEAAHLGASGGLARGGASYEYQKGPDGQNYAVGGEVSIDSSPVESDPEATIAKAQQIRSAALAPASPSSQDYRVAAKASQMEAEARQELSKTDSDSQNAQNSQDTQDSRLNEDLKNTTENKTGNQSSQYVASSAVSKYSVQSQRLSLGAGAGFSAIA